MPANIPRRSAARALSVCITFGILSTAACAGEPKTPPSDSAVAQPAAAVPAAGAPAAAPSTAAAAAPITGVTHDVKMIGDATGYRYLPATLTIKVGDGVRWTMIAGGPHNVSFWTDSIPAGAAAQLNSAMAKQIMPLAGPLLMQPNETYTISFAGATKGTYRYFCTPHLAMKMVGTITVQ